MALPPEHPFWSAWTVIVPLSVVSGLFVYFRAHRLAAPALVAARGMPWIRRNGAIGCALSSVAFGMIAGVVYGQVAGEAPDSAWLIFGIGGTAAAGILTAVAAVVRRGQGLRGTAELAVLNVLWGCGYGWLIPAVAGPFYHYLLAA